MRALLSVWDKNGLVELIHAVEHRLLPGVVSDLCAR